MQYIIPKLAITAMFGLVPSLCNAQTSAKGTTSTPGDVAGTSIMLSPQDSGTTATDTTPGDIVVTAQRRSERLRDVPISITALPQEKLIEAGINSTVDLQRVTPGVQLPFYGGFLQPSIRGISSAGAGLGDSSNVAVYVDGIYQPSEAGQLIDLPDVQQVEILKGPQGTLYGQNAAGGAIAITTVAPSFTLAGRLSASYGNYDDKILRGYVTGPIAGDTIALSVAGAYENRNGFNRNVLTGGRDTGLDSKLIRARLLVKPTSNLSLTVGAYYSRRSDGGIYAGEPVGPGTPLGYALANAFGVPVTKATQPHQFALNTTPLTLITTYGFNLLGKLETGIGTVSTVTAYSNVKVHDIADADYTAINLGAVDNLSIRNSNFIQEVNFVSNRFGRATVSAGLFFLGLRESYAPNEFTGFFTKIGDPVTAYPTIGTPLFVQTQLAYNSKHSYAGYAEINYAITDQLNLTAGGRYSYETQHTADNHDVGTVLLQDPRGTPSFSKFTPRATLRYALNPTSNVYASFSQGFKSGYVNSADSPNPPLTQPVRPETVTAYEVGYKGRPIHGVTLNLAAFYYNYDDLQVYTYSPPTEFYRNAASAHIKGLDGDVTVDLVHDLTFTAGASYLDAHYTKFTNAVAYVPNGFGFGYDVTAADASGNRLPRAPSLSGNAALTYAFDTQAGRIGAYVDGSYNSGISYDSVGSVQQGRYALLDAQISFAPAGVKGLRLVAFGRNLTDHAYLASVLETQFALGASYADPRTYGIRAEFAF